LGPPWCFNGVFCGVPKGEFGQTPFTTLGTPGVTHINHWYTQHHHGAPLGYHASTIGSPFYSPEHHWYTLHHHRALLGYHASTIHWFTLLHPRAPLGHYGNTIGSPFYTPEYHWDTTETQLVHPSTPQSTIGTVVLAPSTQTCATELKKWTIEWRIILLMFLKS
jgi:hypothetical protein